MNTEKDTTTGCKQKDGTGKTKPVSANIEKGELTINFGSNKGGALSAPSTIELPVYSHEVHRIEGKPPFDELQRICGIDFYCGPDDWQNSLECMTRSMYGDSSYTQAETLGKWIMQSPPLYDKARRMVMLNVTDFTVGEGVTYMGQWLARFLIGQFRIACQSSDEEKLREVLVKVLLHRMEQEIPLGTTILQREQKHLRIQSALIIELNRLFDLTEADLKIDEVDLDAIYGKGDEDG